MINIKKLFKYVGLTSLFFMSFYYTEKVALYVKNKNPIMQEINNNKDSLVVNSIDSELIDTLYIIPGLNGKEVDINKSFSNMIKLETYDENNIIYTQIKPNISLENNKNRIIVRGNSKIVFHKSFLQNLHYSKLFNTVPSSKTKT